MLKEKILKNYPSINQFCLIHEISYDTIKPYTSGKKSINVISAKVLSRLCTALQCCPEDIGFTKDCDKKQLEDRSILIVYRLDVKNRTVKLTVPFFIL